MQQTIQVVPLAHDIKNERWLFITLSVNNLIWKWLIKKIYKGLNEHIIWWNHQAILVWLKMNTISWLIQNFSLETVCQKILTHHIVSNLICG